MNQKNSLKRTLSRISALHYAKLVFRSLLFLAAAGLYLYGRITAKTELFDGLTNYLPFVAAIGLIFALEMVLRFFPSKVESMGCQKQFAHNFSPTAVHAVPEPEKRRHTKSALTVAIAWIAFNAAIGALYFNGLIDRGILILISLAFSVCDMICILFFCPFQTWIMKNKCCGSCRIYNWDYAMMFTPLVLIKSPYTWALFGLSFVLLIKWEAVYLKHPERFSEVTNASLTCAQCKEKLCSHKKSLQRFLKRNWQHLKS